MHEPLYRLPSAGQPVLHRIDRLAAHTTVRQSDVERLRSLWKDSHEPVLLIVGERGMGKSRLLASLEMEAAAEVHRVRINPSEANIPHSGLSTLLAALHEPEAMSISAKLLSQANGAADTMAQATELLALLGEPSRPRTLILIDDIDRMDAESQDVIAMIASRLGGGSVSVIATASEAMDPPLVSLPAYRLERLTSADSMRLLREPSLPPMTEAVQRIVIDQSSGNPGALIRNARALMAEQLVGDAPLAIPFRVSRSSSSAASYLLNTAAASRRVVLAQLSCALLTASEAIEQPPAVIADVLDDFLADGTVERVGSYIRIRDPLLRSRMYWSLGAASRAEYHATAARAHAGDPGLAAWHKSWLIGSRVEPTELLTCATRFARSGFTGQAIELAERALTLVGNPVVTSLELFRLANVMFLGGELAYAARYARFARRTGTMKFRGNQALLRAWIDFIGSHQVSTADLDCWLNADDPKDRDFASRALSSVALFHAERWEADAARAAISRARQLAETSEGSADAVALAETFIAAVEGNDDPVCAMLDRVNGRGLAAATPEQLTLLGRSLTFAERYSDARRVLKTVTTLEPTPQTLWLETANYALADNEILAGNQFEAVTAINNLIREGASPQLHRHAHLLMVAWYRLALDDLDGAAAAIAECHRNFASGDNPAMAARLEAFQGHFDLARDQIDEAIPFLRSTASFASRLRLPTLLRYEVDLIDAYASTGRGADAVAALRELHATITPTRSRYSMLLAARAQALVAQGEQSIAAFQRALKLWRPGDPSFELARTHLSFGDRLAALGNRQEGAEQRLAARLIFSQLGASSWATKAASGLRTDDRVPEHPLLSTLSWDERAVAELVCRGFRNKEIARELFISLRTVEVRLTRIYHKTHVRSRSELVAALANSSSFADNYANPR